MAIIDFRTDPRYQRGGGVGVVIPILGRPLLEDKWR